jgi:hypothetical protein
MTKFFQFAIKTIAPAYPLRLSLAIIIGLNVSIGLDVLTPFMSPLYQNISGKIGALGCISFSIMLFFLPLGLRSNRLSEDIEQKFTLIRRAAEEGQLTKVQRRLLYLQLVRIEIANRKSVVSKKEEQEIA